MRGRLWEKELTTVVPGSEDDDVLVVEEVGGISYVILRHEARRPTASIGS